MPTSVIAKLTRGNRTNVHRLQDEKGNFIGIGRLARHLPKAALSTALRVVLRRRPVLPWISYDAIRAIEEFLQPSHDVLEFGSGMSTLWFARRARRVVSIESSEQWFRKVGDLLERYGCTNTERHLSDARSYAHQALSGRKFDVVLIDGDRRAECADRLSDLVRPGALIYLDNSDKDWNEPGGELRRAEQSVLAFAQRCDASIEYFTDFSPAQLFVQQGMLVRVPY
jgi:hypothetical protein